MCFDHLHAHLTDSPRPRYIRLVENNFLINVSESRGIYATHLLLRTMNAIGMYCTAGLLYKWSSTRTEVLLRIRMRKPNVTH